ncbi:nucleoside ABC transporter, periplasmic nucleoside-binding protein [Lachnospiraceae bacterium KM106-2]|nr:nucleoside ABC transporter, periplasmic nucleoside-binding protein [Lachnospiraceae bacterium KM106-2]
MKKKLLSVLLTLTMVSTLLVGCGTKNNAGSNNNADKNSGAAQSEDTSDKEHAGTADKDGKYEIALITDVGTIDDKSFNQGSWEGVEEYAKANDVSYKYYKPTEKSDDAMLTAIKLAVKGGAKVVVCPGFLFETPVYQAQTMYPDVTFLIVDGAPKDASEKVSIESNTQAIYYAEEQAGYLAGYAAVKDGYKKLGFMGGLALPAVVRYGYGFVQGAEAAAKDMGLKAGEVTIKYNYAGTFEATPEVATAAAAWYKEGVEVIFACGGGVGNSVMKSAETAKKKVIGVDVDQSSESKTVITSAMKNLKKSVSEAIASYYDGKFNGGKEVVLDATTNSVELPMETSQFTNFTKEDYDSLYKKVVNGDVKIKKDTDAKDATGLGTSIVKVNVVK